MSYYRGELARESYIAARDKTAMCVSRSKVRGTAGFQLQGRVTKIVPGG
jgi:hypothetical protein